MSTAAVNAKEIATTIYKQIGGGRAKVMIGMYAQGYSTDDDGNPYLSFRFKAGRKANYCKITLTPLDTYDMTIKPLFEEATGLCLSLGI